MPSLFKTVGVAILAILFVSIGATSTLADSIDGTLGYTGAFSSFSTGPNGVFTSFGNLGKVNVASGTFGGLGLIGTLVFTADFSYSPTVFGSPFPLLVGSDGITLSLTDITAGFVDASGLHVTADGILTESGFTSTLGTFTLDDSNLGDYKVTVTT